MKPRFKIYDIEGNMILVTPTDEESNPRHKSEFELWKINLDCPTELRREFGLTFIARTTHNHQEHILEVFKKYEQKSNQDYIDMISVMG